MALYDETEFLYLSNLRRLLMLTREKVREILVSEARRSGPLASNQDWGYLFKS
jgi:hypothetical protein